MGAIQRLPNLSIMLLVVLVGFSGTVRAETAGEKPDPEKIARMKAEFEKAEKERINASKKAAEEATTMGQGGMPVKRTLDLTSEKAEQLLEPKPRPTRKTGKPTPPSSKSHDSSKNPAKHHVHKKGKTAKSAKSAKSPKAAKAGTETAVPKGHAIGAPQMSQELRPIPMRIRQPETFPTAATNREPVVPAQVSRGTYAGTAADLPAKLQTVDVARVLATTRDLHGRDMTNLSLRGLDFSGANLSDAVLKGADLFHANFSRALLTRTDLTGASLERANFSNAKMQGALLNDARLFFANFEGADLENAQMRHCYAPGARLRKANLHKTDMRDCDFSGANFDGSTLTGAQIDGTPLIESPPIPDYVLKGAP